MAATFAGGAWSNTVTACSSGGVSKCRCSLCSGTAASARASNDSGLAGGGDGDACGKRQIREQVATSCRSQTLHRRVHKPGMSYTYTCILFIPTCSSSPQPSPKPDPNPCPNPNPNANHTYFHEMNVRVLYLSFRREEPGLRHQPLVEVWKSAQRNRT